ncbi:MAG TPA: bifunctional phosphoribosylaminoimidazolecarboxamide formyltransferase/IMP cyclohydrolase [Mycobacteriales bacterium]|nr:bifunctional phosphoribosylaminoimidazolecarboxamide formyltransferase/IMP cyclohydrolase [Mycobacteriales bacterium]
MSEQRPVQRALVSVYDKTGLEELARGLHAHGVEIVSTGSTAKAIEAAGVPVTPVSAVTGFPEILDGRVKTLHPHVHAGLLADLRLESHQEQLVNLGIQPFNLVVVNLYPFRETVASGASPDEIVEQIDIGGPSMVRASAKNHASVAVVVSPDSYGDVIAAVAAGGFTLEQRQALAVKAFRHTASYDIAVASWMGSVIAPDDDGSGFPSWMAGEYERRDVLRYGENPHQRAALYVTAGSGDSLATAEQLHGKAMSYNNYIDTDAAMRAAWDFSDPCVAIIKHANPCGIALGADVADAHRKAHACDPTSAFGGVIAVNRPVTLALAEQVSEIFTEVIVAPDFEPAAVELLAKKPSIRILRTGSDARRSVEQRQVGGGLLVQSADAIAEAGDLPGGWTLAAGKPLDDDLLADLAFAWRAVRAVKSNAILLAKDRATVGVGMGQVNRVDAARLAVARAGEERARGSVGASDAFFPFADGFEVLAAAGVVAVAEPGGSVRDQEVIDAADAAGVSLYFTGVRHFAH